MENWIKSEDFGSGSVVPVAYCTAWVAMISDTQNQVEPAFPQSLQWLRDNQLSDGSWGSKYPCYIYDRILSTLVTIICLMKYKFECDLNILTSGISAAQLYLNRLNNLSINKNITSGFELILPTLIDKCADIGIEFNQNELIDKYREEKEAKLKKIFECENSNSHFENFQKSWYFSLEALDDIYDKQKLFSIMNKDNHLLGSSYSATAYAIIKYPELEESKREIQQIVLKNNGGIPVTYKMEIFDLSWSIEYIIMSGYDIRNLTSNKSLNRLSSLWIASKGLVGGGVGFPPDGDVCANCIFVLSSANILLKTIDDLQSLLKFYQNNYFLTFESERHPSLSTNINCLIALNNYRHIPFANDIIVSVQSWVKSKIIENNYSFEDKWHYSPFYSMSRAVFAFELIDKSFSDSITKLMVTKQNCDGGWGVDGISSAEESAYVIIALAHWNKNHFSNYNNDIFESLKKSKEFMNSNTDIDAFWIAKTLYCPETIVKTAISAAKYLLENIDY